MHPRDTQPRDEVDRLYSQLRPLAPPPDLSARILAALPAERPTPVLSASRQRLWGWVTAVAALLLLGLCIQLGSQLEESGAFSVLNEIFADLGNFFASPGDYLSTLAAALPWGNLVLALLALCVFWYGGGQLTTTPTTRKIMPRQRQ